MADDLNTDGSERTELLSDPKNKGYVEAKFRQKEYEKLGFGPEDFADKLPPPNWSAVNPFKVRVKGAWEWTTHGYGYALFPSISYMLLLT